MKLIHHWNGLETACGKPKGVLQSVQRQTYWIYTRRDSIRWLPEVTIQSDVLLNLAVDQTVIICRYLVQDRIAIHIRC